jgi:hypothetical protein
MCIAFILIFAKHLTLLITLLNKLYTYGVRDPFLSWTSTYISNRTQHVVLKGVRSSAYCSTSGVPQGSIIGPLLFIIFINYITDSLTSASLLYADDLKIYKIIKTQLDVFDLQEDVRRIENWCARNDMKLNVCKCKAMCFGRKTVPSVPYYYWKGSSWKLSMPSKTWVFFSIPIYRFMNITTS